LLSWISRFGSAKVNIEDVNEFCFNPCCLGLAVLAEDGFIESLMYAGFNPCCLGLAVLAFANPAAVNSFLGFNPCCLGLAVLATNIYNALVRNPAFQSLLSWISRFG